MTKLKITLGPIKSEYGFPEIDLAFNGKNQNIILENIKTYEFDLLKNNNKLSVIMKNKNNKDATQGVIVTDLNVAGYKHVKIFQKSKYFPIYPEPWATQQRSKGIILDKCIFGSNNIGWNGKWCLEIDKPVFTWLHHTLSHGWIYPTDHFNLTD